MDKAKVVIVSGARTPIGTFCGSLSSLKAHQLGTIVIKEVLGRANLKPSDVCEVIMGQALTTGEGQNPARQAAVNAGIPYSVPAFIVNMLCGSGLKSVALGYQSIASGESDIVVCGGQESMSQSPHFLNIRTGQRMGATSLEDSMLHDGLTDAFHNIHMGETAENVAKKYNITRKEQDEYAAESQQKTETAQKSGFFKNEICPVIIPNRQGSTTIDCDEFPKHGTTTEGLSKLKPVFIKDGGTVTAGNASGINDGAAAVILMSEKAASARGISPIAHVVACAQVGIDPQYMGLGPIQAVKTVLKKANWGLDEVDLFELNEAFAAQSIAVMRELGIAPEKINVNGGAIAIGHPVGASGTRVLVTLLYTLLRTGKKRGVAALCVGGGMGIAIAVECGLK